MLKITTKLLSIFIVIAWSVANAGGPEYVSTEPTSGGFNQVDVNGYVDVIIRQSGQSSVVTTSASVNPVNTRVSNHRLYIEAPGWSSQLQSIKRPVVSVNLPELTKLVVNGQANVAGTNLHSHGLTIEANGSGKIKLIGMINLKNIQQTGQNRLYLRWIDSDTLTVTSTDAGFIYLGGIAKTVYARLYHRATFNAEYLRANTMQVQTNDYASAFVYPVTTLRAFANDNGNIYYYAYPYHMTRSTSQSGNVLQMAWRPN